MITASCAKRRQITWNTEARFRGHFPWYLTTGSRLSSFLSFSLSIIQWYLHSVLQFHSFHCKYKGSCAYHDLSAGRPSGGTIQCLMEVSFREPVLWHSSTQDLVRQWKTRALSMTGCSWSHQTKNVVKSVCLCKASCQYEKDRSESCSWLMSSPRFEIEGRLVLILGIQGRIAAVLYPSDP
jgi:hypothetical protein